MISKMLHQVNDWDVDSLIDHVQWSIEQTLNDLSYEQLKEEYNDWFNLMPGDEDYRQVSKIKEEKKAEEACPRCNKMKDIGTKCWWCGF